jgi:hypothetical protein
VPLSSGSSGSRRVGLVELLQIVGTIKGEVRVHAMKAYRGDVSQLHLFLTSAIDVGKVST